MAEKCTFGTRPPIDNHMLDEIIYREVKHFRNYTIYRPNFGSIPVTGKFYAANDELQSMSKEELKKIDNYCRNVSQARVLGPHKLYPAPVTSSHEYGWYFKPLMPVDKSDRRFNHHRRESIHTKIEVIISMSNPKSRKT